MAIDKSHEAIRDILINASSVTSYTSTVVPFARWRTEDLPAVTYQRISRENQYTIDDNGKIKNKQDRLQYNCWDRSYQTANDLAVNIENELDDYRDNTIGNVYIHRIRVDDIQDVPDSPPQGEEIPIYGVRIEVIITYE